MLLWLSLYMCIYICTCIQISNILYPRWKYTHKGLPRPPPPPHPMPHPPRILSGGPGMGWGGVEGIPYGCIPILDIGYLMYIYIYIYLYIYCFWFGTVGHESVHLVFSLFCCSAMHFIQTWPLFPKTNHIWQIIEYILSCFDKKYEKIKEIF